jgi:hypothetical protein
VKTTPHINKGKGVSLVLITGILTKKKINGIRRVAGLT